MKLLTICLISLISSSCASALPKSFPDIDLGYIYSGADISPQDEQVRFSNLKDPKNPKKKYVKSIPEASKNMVISLDHYLKVHEWIKNNCEAK